MTELETIAHIKKTLDELEGLSKEVGASELHHLIGASALAASDVLEMRVAQTSLMRMEPDARR